MDSYRKKQWIEFREEIIELDDFKCIKCGKSRDEGAVLQVHHVQYIPDKNPWEYPFELCETLCKGCHAAGHGVIRPEHGWSFVGEDDLGGLYGTCERCGTEIRYAYLVQHPKWEPITVGTVCCDDLTGTKIASDLRKYDGRLKRFYKSKRWRKEGNDLFIRQKQLEIKISENDSIYIIQIGKTKGKMQYSSLEDAMKRVFDFIESGDADAYFKKR